MIKTITYGIRWFVVCVLEGVAEWFRPFDPMAGVTESPEEYRKRCFEENQAKLRARREREDAERHDFPLCEVCLRDGVRDNCEACVSLLTEV
jgi:hypothetical protein